MLCNDLYGKRIRKRVDIYIHIIDSLCYTPRTNTTLYIKMGHIFLSRFPWNGEKSRDFRSFGQIVNNKITYCGITKMIAGKKTSLLQNNNKNIT